MRLATYAALIVTLALGGCLGDSDQADSTTGPAIDVHCDAAQPTGATTVKVDCPPH
jgi:hypothetical protein